MPEARGNPNGSAPWSIDLRGTTVPALVEVRRWASRTLTELDDAHLIDVLTVATELVTNAYEHGQGPLEVRMSHTAVPCRVRIEVDDSNLAPPVVEAPSPEVPGGRGMRLVDKLAAEWGVRKHPVPGSKTVWAVVTCDGVDAIPCGSASD